MLSYYFFFLLHILFGIVSLSWAGFVMLSKYVTKFIEVNSHIWYLKITSFKMDEENVKWLWRSFLEFSITNRTFFFLQLSFYWLCPFPPSFSFHSSHLFMSTPHVGIAWFCVLYLTCFFSIFSLAVCWTRATLYRWNKSNCCT